MKIVIVKIRNPPTSLRTLLARLMFKEGAIYFGVVSKRATDEIIELLYKTGLDFVVWRQNNHATAGLEVVASKGKNISDVILW